MLESLISGFLSAQFGDVRRRTKGAMLEAAALGMIGFSAVWFFFGSFLWLSIRIEAWQAGILLSGIALAVAAILMVLGRSLVRKKEPNPHDQVLSTMKALGILSQSKRIDGNNADRDQEAGPPMIAAALAAGIMLGRSVKR